MPGFTALVLSCDSRQRPRWWLMAMMPGLMPSVTQTLSTNQPISVSTRISSPVATPRRRASSGCIQTGLLWLIS